MKTEYWQAIVDCDKEYDGEFYYGVLTTGIFCRPSCKSRLPKVNNVKIFRSVEEAENEGLRPCKRCRPQFMVNQSSAEELIAKVKQLIEASYAADLSLHEIASRCYVSPFYLQRVFKQVTQISPTQYLIKKRIEAAKQLIEQPAFSITEIALQVGFKNPAHFSSVFSKEVGLPPSKYRGTECRKNHL
jgi:AraC family transcriptional regulator, regulatory protein of adaptative response / methylphosphotriester-DNA alkyltransferase methyltransferase